jgi:hypothetical protein
MARVGFAVPGLPHRDRDRQHVESPRGRGSSISLDDSRWRRYYVARRWANLIGSEVAV